MLSSNSCVSLLLARPRTIPISSACILAQQWTVINHSCYYIWGRVREKEKRSHDALAGTVENVECSFHNWTSVDNSRRILYNMNSTLSLSHSHIFIFHLFLFSVLCPRVERKSVDECVSEPTTTDFVRRVVLFFSSHSCETKAAERCDGMQKVVKSVREYPWKSFFLSVCFTFRFFLSCWLFLHL